MDADKSSKRLLHLAGELGVNPYFATGLAQSTICPLNTNDEFRAVTNKPEIFDKSVIRSSEMPSATYSCSGSPLMLVNGRTATDGLSGGAGEAWNDDIRLLHRPTE